MEGAVGEGCRSGCGGRVHAWRVRAKTQSPVLQKEAGRGRGGSTNNLLKHDYVLVSGLGKLKLHSSVNDFPLLLQNTVYVNFGLVWRAKGSPGNLRLCKWPTSQEGAKGERKTGGLGCRLVLSAQGVRVEGGRRSTEHPHHLWVPEHPGVAHRQGVASLLGESLF